MQPLERTQKGTVGAFGTVSQTVIIHHFSWNGMFNWITAVKQPYYTLDTQLRCTQRTRIKSHIAMTSLKLPRVKCYALHCASEPTYGHDDFFSGLETEAASTTIQRGIVRPSDIFFQVFQAGINPSLVMDQHVFEIGPQL